LDRHAQLILALEARSAERPALEYANLTFAAPAVFRESATVKPFSCNVAGGKTAE